MRILQVIRRMITDSPWVSHRGRWPAVMGGAVLLGACATVPPPPAQSPAARCLALYAAVDQAVARSGTRPSAAARIEGFPHLRVDRFLADYRQRPLNPAERGAWLARLAELDRRARQVELASLPKEVTEALALEWKTAEPLPQVLAGCGRTLQGYDLARPERLARLRRRAAVPDDYRTWQRLAGLYPLAALPVSLGVSRWHREMRRAFAVPLPRLKVQGELRRLRPAEPARPPYRVEPARDVLDIPEPDAARLADLFAFHAPVWEIDTAGVFDLPGAPFWSAAGTPSVDPSQAVVYRYASYTRWRDRPLLQLNYLIWFAERPRRGAFDILGGALDGLIWRVTLDPQGKPLLYDAVHPCGCYHLFFPTTALRLRRAALDLPEPPLVPQFAPGLPPGRRMVVRIGSGDHFIQRIYPDKATGESYLWRDYEALYAVSAGRGTRSLFGPGGLVPGSERAERWLLWPMGIPSPGAMRERGHQATAFVGRRHFDDPDLLERLFQPGEAE